MPRGKGGARDAAVSGRCPAPGAANQRAGRGGEGGWAVGRALREAVALEESSASRGDLVRFRGEVWPQYDS